MAVVRTPVVVAVALVSALAVAIPAGLHASHAKHHSGGPTASITFGQPLEGFPVYKLVRGGQARPAKPQSGEQVVPASGIVTAFDVLSRRPLATLRARYAWVNGSYESFTVQIYTPPDPTLTALAGRGEVDGIVDGVAVHIIPIRAEPRGGPNFGVGFRTQSEAVAFADSLTTQVTNNSHAT
jgi:hypothetical protein